MRGLKSLVFIMGVLLVVGFAALVAVIVSRMKSPAGAPAVATAMPQTAPGKAVAGDVKIALPHGAKLLDMQSVNGRLALRVELPDENQEVILIDPESGEIVRTLKLEHAQ